MKKFLLIVIAGLAAALAGKKYKSAQQEQALWAEATDSVDRS